MQIRPPSTWGWLRDIAFCLATPLVIFALMIMVARHLGPLPIDSPRILASAYPDAIRSIHYSEQGWVLHLAGGQDVLYSDGKHLPFEERLDDMDPASIFVQPYSFGTVPLPVLHYSDPGRLRYNPLLEAAYGASKAEVVENLEQVDFFGVRLLFNRHNGAAEALRKIVAQICEMPELYAFMQTLSRTRMDGAPAISSFNWRLTEGTTRLSAHSFGIAVDIVVRAKAPMYWRWIKSDNLDRFEATDTIATMPPDLVAVFEDNGFIWGGKWHHFDTMHFEYRPEFLARRNFFNQTGVARANKGADFFPQDRF